MKTILNLLFLTLAGNCFAQLPVMWKGKTPGHSGDWFCATNWNSNVIPDEFSDVFIPFSEDLASDYPIIVRKNVEINSIRISPGAKLIISDADIKIADLQKSYFKPDQIVQKNMMANRDTFYPDAALCVKCYQVFPFLKLLFPMYK